VWTVSLIESHGACYRDGYVRVVRSKLMYRVVFPFELKLGSTSAEDGPNGADAAYQLFAVIVHVGSGLDHGERTSCQLPVELPQRIKAS
jgi:hypothetical protein